MATALEAARANQRVAAALKSGKLTKQPCEVCGRTDDVEAHHDDYSKPLDVKWLCPPHHKAEHKENGHRIDRHSVLNIRRFPDELARKLKIEAATRGISLKALVIEILSDGEYPAKPMPEVIQEPTDASEVKSAPKRAISDKVVDVVEEVDDSNTAGNHGEAGMETLVKPSEKVQKRKVKPSVTELGNDRNMVQRESIVVPEVEKVAHSVNCRCFMCKPTK